MTNFFPDTDYLEIAGDRSPGIARLIRADSPSGLDVRRPYGLIGGTVVPMGEELAEVEFSIELYDETDIPTWYAFARKWLTRPVFNMGAFYAPVAATALPDPGALTWNMLGSQPGAPSPSLNVAPAAPASSGPSIRAQFEALALPIRHAGLNNPPLNITQVIRKNCSALMPDGLGLWVATVSFLQFRLPKKQALPKPTTALPNTKNPRPTALDAYQVIMQQNEATLEALR